MQWWGTYEDASRLLRLLVLLPGSIVPHTSQALTAESSAPSSSSSRRPALPNVHAHAPLMAENTSGYVARATTALSPVPVPLPGTAEHAFVRALPPTPPLGRPSTAGLLPAPRPRRVVSVAATSIQADTQLAEYSPTGSGEASPSVSRPQTRRIASGPSNYSRATTQPVASNIPQSISTPQEPLAVVNESARTLQAQQVQPARTQPPRRSTRSTRK